MGDDKYWYDDDRLYPSGRDSDDSPILSHRYEKSRLLSPYPSSKQEDRERRYTLTMLAKFFLFCTAMILFFVLMYIPVYNKANDQMSKVRYILKTDDDMYINVPNLMDNLKNRSKEFDTKNKGRKIKEYMLIGDLICGARPVLDSSNKWYSPKYMYGGRVYPRYLSGTGYALSADTAAVLYEAALRTNFFHLEDVFITGMCASRSRPRMVPRDDPTFSYVTAAGSGAAPRACAAHARATAHRVPPGLMRALHHTLKQPHLLDICERMHLTKVRRDRLKPKKTHPTKRSKH